MNDTVVCPRCSRTAVIDSAFCSDCGLPLKAIPLAQKRSRRITIPGAILAILIILLLIGFMRKPSKEDGNNQTVSAESSTGTSTHNDGAVSPPAKPIAYSIGQGVYAGYWSYRINRASWMPFLPTGYSLERPDAEFLILDITVRNNDRTSSTLPPVKLVNAAGQEFSESHAGSMSQGFFFLKELNPGVESTGLIAFDVPRGEYRAVLSGGYESEAYVMVDIPGPKMQTQSDSEESPKSNSGNNSSEPANIGKKIADDYMHHIISESNRKADEESSHPSPDHSGSEQVSTLPPTNSPVRYAVQTQAQQPAIDARPSDPQVNSDSQSAPNLSPKTNEQSFALAFARIFSGHTTFSDVQLQGMAQSEYSRCAPQGWTDTDSCLFRHPDAEVRQLLVNRH